MQRYRSVHRDEIAARRRRDRAEHPDKHHVYYRRHYIKHAVKLKAKRKAYWRSHREQSVARHREWMAKNPQRVKEHSSKYYRKHAVRIRKRMRQNYAADPEKFRKRQRDKYAELRDLAMKAKRAEDGAKKGGAVRAANNVAVKRYEVGKAVEEQKSYAAKINETIDNMADPKNFTAFQREMVQLQLPKLLVVEFFKRRRDDQSLARHLAAEQLDLDYKPVKDYHGAYLKDLHAGRVPAEWLPGA